MHYNKSVEVVFHTVLYVCARTLFEFLGIYYILLLLPLMVGHVQGTITDIDYLWKASVVEWQLLLYFGPTTGAWILRGLLKRIKETGSKFVTYKELNSLKSEVKQLDKDFLVQFQGLVYGTPVSLYRRSINTNFKPVAVLV